MSVMTVGKLKKLLAEHDDSILVIMSSDGEGNNYFPMDDGIDEYIYVSNSNWAGQVYLPELTENEMEQGYTEEDLYDGDDGKLAIVLYPNN